MLLNILDQALSLISTAYIVKASEKQKEIEKSIQHTEICIIGGGCAAINFSAQILKQKHAIVKPEQIRIIEPSDTLYYQPGQTMVGGCLIPNEEAEKQLTRPNRQYFHKDIKFTKGEVDQIFPEENKFVTKDGKIYSYDQLLIFSGVKPVFETIKGLKQALDDPNCPVGSIYNLNYAKKNQTLIKNFKGGNALFHEPKGPFKCGGAPTKIVFLAQDYWKKQNLLSKTNIEFWKFSMIYFPVKMFNDTIEKLFNQKKVKVVFGEEMIEVIPHERKAIFQNLKTGQLTTKTFDYMHALAQNQGHEFVAKSGDVGTTFGLVNVDINTFQHVKYKNIWSAGDAANLPTSKTAAAVMSQVPILIKNFVSSYKFKKNENFLKYDGYSACPIFVGDDKLLLAEFIYGMIPKNSLVKDQDKPRKSFFYMKKYLFPWVYFNLMHKAQWFGKHALRNPYP